MEFACYAKLCMSVCHHLKWVSRREDMCDWNSSVGRHLLSSGGQGHNPPRCKRFILFVLLLKSPLWGCRGPVCPSDSQLRLTAYAGRLLSSLPWRGSQLEPPRGAGNPARSSAWPLKPLQPLHLPGCVTPSSCRRGHFIPRGAAWQVEETLAL